MLLVAYTVVSSLMATMLDRQGAVTAAMDEEWSAGLGPKVRDSTVERTGMNCLVMETQPPLPPLTSCFGDAANQFWGCRLSFLSGDKQVRGCWDLRQRGSYAADADLSVEKDNSFDGHSAHMTTHSTALPAALAPLPPAASAMPSAPETGLDPCGSPPMSSIYHIALRGDFTADSVCIRLSGAA